MLSFIWKWVCETGCGAEKTADSHAFLYNAAGRYCTCGAKLSLVKHLVAGV